MTAKIFLVILKFFLVKADIGVSCHCENASFLHAVSIEQSHQPMQKDIFRTHKTLSVRQQQIRRYILRYRHDTYARMPLFIFQQRYGIQQLVSQMRHRVIRSDHDRRQNRQ